MAVEMTERARSLLNDLMNAGIIRDIVFAHVEDTKQLKELVTLSKEYMPSVVKSLWLEATEEKFAKLSGVCAPERLELYRSSIEVPTADARKDLRDFVELRAKFPKLRIVKGSCKNHRDSYHTIYDSPTSSATIEFGEDGSKPRLDLELEKGYRLNDPKLGLWPPEKGVFDLRRLTTLEALGDHETWEFGYNSSASSEKEDVKIYPFPCEGLDEEVFFRTVFVNVEMVYLRSCATKLSHLRAIVDVAHGLKRLVVVVSEGSHVRGWEEEKRQSKEMAQQFEKTVVKLGHLEHLEHLNLFAEKENLSCLHHMQTLPWKALRTLECNVEPSIVLRKRYGRKQKPRQLLRPPQSPPPGKLEKVVIHLNGELHRPPNPMFFAYALLEIFPLDVIIGFTKGEPSSFRQGGLKCWDYQQGFNAISFEKWVKGALKAMVKEFSTGLKASQQADANEGSRDDAADHDGGSKDDAQSDDNDGSDDDYYYYESDESD